MTTSKAGMTTSANNALARLELTFVHSHAKDNIAHARALIDVVKSIQFEHADETTFQGLSIVMSLIDILLEQAYDSTVSKGHVPTGTST